MEYEIREVIYISLALMLTAIVLSFISYGMGVVGEFAAIRNQEVISTERVEEYREYNGYDRETLCGDDVIELIRGKYNSGIKVFVNSRQKGTNTISDNAKCSLCADSTEDHRYFDSEMYIRHAEAGLNPPDNGVNAYKYNYFAVSRDALTSAAEPNNLRNWFNTKEYYRAYLVYGGESPLLAYERLMKNYVDKGGISATTLKNKIDVLDTGYTINTQDEKVTGIVLISMLRLDTEAAKFV